jgi:hypothetical protein
MMVTMVGRGSTMADSCIALNPCNSKPVQGYGRINAIAMGRLGTLPHEVVHAFISKFARRYSNSCSVTLVDAGGHCIVWQRIADWIEHAARASIRRHRTKALSTLEEVTIWELEDYQALWLAR